jgi:hypothetical protein
LIVYGVPRVSCENCVGDEGGTREVDVRLERE